MDCSICLDKLENKDTYILSCGHEFHTRCYQKCVYNNNFNMFIKCPLCRELNINTEKPYDNTYDNLKCWTKLERCKCKTKSGKRCKKRSLLFNNGMCAIHQKPLAKDKYDLMLKYIYLILSQRNNWFSKIHLFDIGKKLIIKNNLNEIEEIMFYFYKFINLNGIKSIQDYYSMYDYYELKRPQLPWVNHCYKNFTFT